MVLLTLGTWQVQRLQWKEDLIAKAEARVDAAPVSIAEALGRAEAGEDTEYLPVSAVGGFESPDVAHVFGTWEGRAGAYVFQAMTLDEPEGRILLVNRGFVPQDQWAESYELPDAEAFTGLVRNYGPERGLSAAVAPDAGSNLLFTRSIEVLADELAPGRKDAVLPFAIDSTLPTELPLGGTTRLEFRNAHLGYALTWYGLALGLAGVTFVLLRKSG
nr:SURF1 family cytochrome oxidase biogenesis protein [Parvularcula maris]